MKTPDNQTLYDELVGVLEGGDERALKVHLNGLEAPDLAEVLELFDDPERSSLLFALDSRTAAEVIVLLDERIRDEVVEDMPDDRLAAMVETLPADDAADLLGELTGEESDHILEKLSEEQSEEVEKLLEYDPETAGGLMNPRVVRVRGSETVGQAIERLREVVRDEEDFGYIYTVSEAGQLTGVVSPRRLVIAAITTPNRRIAEIVADNPYTVGVSEDQERVAQLFRKYDVAALPVVDQEGTLVGQITGDDILDVQAEEADEDMYHMAGTDPAELETSSILRASRTRLIWLLPSFLFMSGTALVLMYTVPLFSEMHYTALVAFVPLVGALAGCCSVQTSTVITRGLATGELARSRLRFVVGREFPISVVMAPACAAIAWFVVYFVMPVFQGGGKISADVAVTDIATSVALGMVAAIVLASGLGIVMPFVFKHLGIDPAIAAGPVVTAANDVVSVSVYLALAYVVLA